jgi:peptidyl-prolyl cis-trans isomerase D
MFDLFRSRAKIVRIMLGGLLLLVALSMVTYLIPGVGMNTAGDSQVAAEFGKEVLSLYDLQQIVQAQMRNQSLPPQLASALVPQIANQVVTEYAVAYEAQRMGFRVSEADMAAAIRQILPQLFSGGQFAGREAYAAFLAQQNMTIPQFEGALRRQLLVQALTGMVTGGIVVSPKEVEEEFHRKNDKVKIEYVALPLAKYASEVAIRPEEIKQYYDQNPTGFQVPEKRSFDLLVVDEDKVAQQVTIPEAELRKEYEQNRDSYRVPERVHVRHILLKTTDKPKEEVAKLKAQAEEILKQLKAGANFADLAKKYSEDPGSAAKGGDLGWIVRGQTVKPFEDAAFSLKPDQISNVISTEYGFHILQVLGKEEAHVRPFEEVKAQLAEERKKQLVYDRMQQLSDQARADLTKAPLSAEKIASTLGLQLIKADHVGADDQVPEIGVSKELADALSSLRTGDVTQVVQISPTKLAVAVVTDVFPAHQAELSAVEGQIRNRLTTEKLNVLLAQKAKEAAEKARSMGGDLKNLAKELGLEDKTTPEFTQSGAIEGVGSASFFEEAFTAPEGQILGPVTVGASQIIYKVVGRTPASASDLAAQRETLEQEIRDRKARERLSLFEENLLTQLVKSGKAKVHQDVINRIVSSYSGS